MTAEQRELMRIAAQRVIRDHETGARDDPFVLAWARRIIAQIKPLGRHLGTGEPISTLPHIEAF